MYLPAIHGLVPPDAVKCISAFLDFCYLARRSDFDRNTLDALNNALHHFHTYREFFQSSGVREWFLVATSAFPGPLSRQYPRFRCSQWALLIHHGISPHHHCQKTVETLKPLRSIGSNANHKPTTGQAGRHTSRLHCTRDAAT